MTMKIEDFELNEQVDYAQQCLNTARHWGLEAEVVVWAMKELKENPKLSIADALSAGLNEWIK